MYKATVRLKVYLGMVVHEAKVLAFMVEKWTKVPAVKAEKKTRSAGTYTSNLQ